MPYLPQFSIKWILACLCLGMLLACAKKPAEQQGAKQEVIDEDGQHFVVGQIFSDRMKKALYGPELIVIQGGKFQQGALKGDKSAQENEKPQHQVEIAQTYAMSRTEITVAQFREFIKNTGYKTQADKVKSSSVFDLASGKLVKKEAVNWRFNHIGELSGDDFPVVHVSFDDAKAYVQWLSARTNKVYRLPTESEWEYAFRAETDSIYPWGKKLEELRDGNLSGDQDKLPNKRILGNAIKNYADSHWGLAPVRQYTTEGFGTFDLLGNASEWVEDCWHDSYRRAPINAEAWVNPGCARRVVRGSSWLSAADQSRISYRSSSISDASNALVGFRVIRVL